MAINLFPATDLISYPPKYIRKPEDFWCFQGVSKEICGMKWVNVIKLKLWSWVDIFDAINFWFIRIHVAKTGLFSSTLFRDQMNGITTFGLANMKNMLNNTFQTKLRCQKFNRQTYELLSCPKYLKWIPLTLKCLMVTSWKLQVCLSMCGIFVTTRH